MSSTNKTTNYELSQFVGSDKPAWLGDYNSDMSKIDTGIHTAQTTATGADGKADSANTNIGTLTSLTTTDKTDLVSAINEVNTSASTAQETANNAYSIASSTGTGLTGFEGKFALTYAHFNDTTPNGRAISNNATFNTSANSDLTTAVNSDVSMFKCYGRQNITVSNTGDVTITLPVSGLTVASSYEILGAGTAVHGDGQKVIDVLPVKLVVKNGEIEMKFNATVTGLWYVWCTPALYFSASFPN